jgi:hypothetical protein
MKALRFVLAVSLFAGSSLLAQSPFDPARLVPRTDSFSVVMGGRAIGSIRESIERTADGFRLTSSQQMAGMSQSTEVSFTRALAMRSVRQNGSARGVEMKIAVDYANGRAKGTATTPGPAGVRSIVVDTTVPSGAVDDNLLQGLLHTLPLAAGKSFTVPLFASGDGVSKEVTITVAGDQTVTVPAGTFETWRLEVTGGQVPVSFWVSKKDPRVVKLGFAGAPLSFELVR